jgi:D-3-phosphoglycerate dehydrogenase
MLDWNILIADALDPSALAILEGGGKPDDRAGISAEDLLEIIGSYDALIVRGRMKVTKEVIQAAGQLKVIGRAGVGVDNIDLAAAQAAKITVVNAPLSTTIAVAELTLGLMLALVRELPRADRGMKAGQWDKKELEGLELHGKTLGIVGMGNIGSAVARRAAAFGMSILGYDTLIEAETITERGAEPVGLPELYRRADFISLHLPLNDQTRGMLDGQAFASMKRGACLICAARGGVINETALLASLESGQVAGAALDVFAEEPPGLTALVAHPRVVATPHIGAQTAEAQVRAAGDIANEVLNALNGEPLRWRIV